MQQNPVSTLGKLLLLACVLVLLLLACELDPPMFSFSYDANGAQSGDLPAPVSLHKGGSTITVAGNTGNLIKPNFSFNSWNTKQDGSGKTYLPGDTFTLAREDVVLYAQWNPNPSYKTTYYRQNADNDDYTLHETENLSGAVNTAAIPVHKIYAGFTENTNHPNTLASGTILADGSLVLKLYYTRNTYTVSFESNGGSAVADRTGVRYGAKLSTPADPTKSGYVFSGWYKEAALSTQWLFASDTVTEDTKLYAKWSASNTTAYTVEHYTQDLNLSTYSKAEIESLSGPTDTTATAVYKTYTGFTKNESNTNTLKSGTITGNGSLVLKLYYTRNTYTVSFQTNSTATINDLTTQPYGTTIAKPNDPAKQGYTFSGWYKEASLTTQWNFINDTIQTDTTLYASWTANTDTPYYVKYYLQDTNGTTYTLQETVAKTGTTATTGTSEAKTYTGFTENTTKSERLTEGTILADGSLVLKRFYDRNTYTLTFNTNGGSGNAVTQDLKYQTSTALTTNAYTRTGYTFSGWATTSNGSAAYADGANYSIGAGTVTLYAKWTANSYTVTFDKQGGTTPAPETKTVTYDGTYGTLATTSKDGYTFSGWYTQASGGDKIESTTTVTAASNHSLYAQWTANNSTAYSVEYYLQDTNGSTYTLQETVAKTGTTATTGTSEAKTYTGFTENTTKSERLPEGTILADGSLVLKRFYDRNTYTLTFNANGGSGNAVAQNLKYQTSTALTPNAYTRNGYTFSGWATTSSGSVAYADGANYSIGAGTVTLYAKWTADSYSITYVLNGGTNAGSNPVSYTIETADITLASPTKTHYTFAGWYASTGSPVTSIPEGSTGAKTFYAKWTPAIYSVIFNANGGSGSMTSQAIPYNTQATLSANSFSRTGYTFASWNIQANGTGTSYTNQASFTMGGTNTNLYAQWTPKSYTVTFDKQGGTTPSPTSKTVTYGNAYGTLATTSRDGYTFAGWYTQASGGTEIKDTTVVSTAGNHNLYAQWTADNATAYKTEHHRQNLSNNDYILFETENLSGVTDTTATAVYKTYTGFTKDESNGNTVASGTITGNGLLVLKLYYTRNTYTVSFESNGGTSVSDLTNQKYGTLINKPSDPTKQGYTFSGWYKETGLTTPWNFASDTVEDMTTLYAKWTADSYSITYTLDGGTNAGSNPATYTIETPTIVFAEPSKPNYTFDGWYASSAFSGSPVTSILEGSTGAKAFYAKWTPTSYTITYNLDGGTNAALNPGSYTIETTTITLAAPTKTRYDFWGWYETSDFSGSVVSTIANGSSGDKALFAKWLPTYYLVLFKANGGSSFMDDQSIRYTYQATLDANAFTLTGYSFTGWNTQADGSGTSYADEESITMGSEHLTLYAQWAANTYTVSFDGQRGAVPDPSSKRVTFGSSYGELPTTSRTGYTFAGWYTAASGGDKIENITAVTTSSSHTLYAHWTANTYAVTFAAEGGTTPSQTTKDVTFNSTYETLATTTRSGYTFAGWYTQASGGDKIESTTTVTTAADHTLYAHWTAKSYIVTFDGQGGSASNPSSKQVTFGSAYGSFATSSRDGYTLAGWYHSSIGSSSLFTESSLVALAEDHTLLAHWDAITYDIAYTLNGGTNSQDNPAHYSIESETITLAAPTRDGYDFVGWYADVNLSLPQPLIPKGSMGNKTLYAKWAVAFYSVSYELDSGTNTPGNPTAYTILENTITLLNPTRSHYTFGGWYTTSEFTGTAVTSIPSGSFGDKTFYAKWVPDSYTITYMLNGGTNASSNPPSYTIETPTITLATPTKLHYDFGGWYAASDFSESAIATIPTGSTGDITLHAKWTLTNYHVIFNANGGSGTMASQAIPYNTQANLTANSFTRTGYSFTGWNTQANGLGTQYLNQALYTIGGADVNLYAQWKKNAYTLTFDKNLGTGTTVTQNLLYATSTPLTANTYTRTGYSFAGWNTLSNGSGTSYADEANYSIGAANATIYAKWTPLTISITFDEEGGTTTSPETIYRDYNTAYGTLPTTTRTGYTFAGWWTGDNGTGTQVISTTKVTATNWHTLYAKWTPNTNTAYKVEHYQQDVSGSGYTLFETENKTGTTATQVTATAKTYAEFNYNNSLSPASGTIAANGSLVLRLYYDRKTYTVTFQSNGGSAVTAYTGIRHGATISAPADPTRSGYVFNLWYADSNLTQRFDFATQTITANTTLYAKWWSGGVGDLGPAGGVVFHDKGVYSDGWRYLEAASTDVVHPTTSETTFAWGGKTGTTINNTLVGGTSQAVGTGEANTTAIATLYPTVASAARFCSAAFSQGGYSDWFLPSLNELDLMGKLSNTMSGAFTLLSGVYWSSSEASASNAYYINVTSKITSTMLKTQPFQLRAARAF